MINHVISHKVNFKTRSIVKDKEKHATMIKMSIHREHIVPTCVCISELQGTRSRNDRKKKPNRKSTQS